jgi:hypothetical protein
LGEDAFGVHQGLGAAETHEPYTGYATSS